MSHSKSRGSLSVRNAAIAIHRYAGLVMSVFLIVAALTGSLLVFYYELDSALNPELMRVAPSAPGAERPDPFTLNRLVSAQLPTDARHHFVDLHRDPSLASRSWVELGHEEWRELFVDPGSGEILGMREWGNLAEGTSNLMPFVYRLHYSLALGEVGVLIFGIVALLWTLDCFVGAYLTFPQRNPNGGRSTPRAWLRRWLPAWLVRTNQLFSFVFTWHRSSGLWVWAMLLVFAWSAVGLNLRDVYQPVMGALTGMQPTAHDRLPELPEPHPEPELSLERALDIGRKLMQEQAAERGFRIERELWLDYATHHGAFVYAVESSLDISNRHPATEVYFSGSDGSLIAFDAPTGINAGNTLSSWLYGLHFGHVFGMWYRLFVVVIGLAVAALSVTGVWIWWRKRNKQRARRELGVASGALSQVTLTLLFASMSGGCASDANDAASARQSRGQGDSRAKPAEGVDAGDGSDAALPVSRDTALYAIASTSFGADGETTYVALVPSLEADTPIDYGQVLEVSGGASVFGMNGARFFALGSGESASITRYEVDARGNFVEGESLSLARYGVSSMWMDPGLVPIVSETKAYVIDSAQMQVIIWDPTSMRVTGSFALEGVAPEDYSSTLFEPDPTHRDGDLLVAATHGEGDATAPFSTLLALDTERDRIAAVVREERCGGLWDSVLDANGNTYFATGVWDAAQHRALGEEFSSAPCLVRVNAGETSFDASYFVELAELTGGRAAGALVGADGDQAFVKVLDESDFGEIGAEDFDEVWSGPHWQWWRIELGADEQAEENSRLPLSAAASGTLSVDDVTYVRNASADFSETTLLRMTPNGPVEGITVRGFPYGVVRVR